jgi:hypothetical protein
LAEVSDLLDLKVRLSAGIFELCGSSGKESRSANENGDGRRYEGDGCEWERRERGNIRGCNTRIKKGSRVVDEWRFDVK